MASLFDLPFDDDDAGPKEGSAVGGPARAAPASGTAPPASPAPPPVTEGRGPLEASAPARDVLTVSELTAAVRECLESRFFEVWVEGEVSNHRPWNGLIYFTLKDESAQLRVIMFRTAVRRLRFALEDGLHVVARGRVSVYEQRGEYQLVCEHVEPRGLGALQLAFEQLKKKLSAEGLFADARKRPLPVLPRKIGIVTSLDGAALRDIVRVVMARHAGVHLVIRPARVQGDGAAEDIARGLAAVARVPGVDVIIVGRGGGSIEDLWAFNEERVARAMAASPVPVISAVGHETDWTIADLVADVRAATPSNAAERVIATKDEFRARIARAAERLRAALRRVVAVRRGRVHELTSRRGLATVPLRIAGRARRIDDLTGALERALRLRLQHRRREVDALRRRVEAQDPRRRLADLRARLLVARDRLGAAVARRRDRAETRLATCVARLDNLSPLAVLGRGYALCWSADGRHLLRDASPALEGQQVRVTLARGQLVCDVRQALPAPAAIAADPKAPSREPS